jgi:sucrose-6F-phosphate phosphohydrolase
MENAEYRIMIEPILLCTDLDRTLLPNGAQPETPGARERFDKLAARSEISLAYVTGRHRELVEEAIAEYGLPRPDYVIGDVGTTIYQLDPHGWESWQEWEEEIGRDWSGMNASDLPRLFHDLSPLQLQESSKQNRFKLSYYIPLQTDQETLLREMDRRLSDNSVRANLIWSVDESSGIGLLDVLPAGATKLHALKFLMQRRGFTLEQTVFAGDSGNDLQVLCSPLHSVLVANAAPEVQYEAIRLAEENGTRDALFLARGNFQGMNGNYSAGILEGVAHFLPQTQGWWQ